MKQILALPVLFMLAACGMDDTPPPDGPLPPLLACLPDQGLVGQSADVLAAMTFPQGTRIFNTGDALTMDFRPDRLNIEIGPGATIVAVSCG
jgi:Peptidase inhibitor I78 family